MGAKRMGDIRRDAHPGQSAGTVVLNFPPMRARLMPRQLGVDRSHGNKFGDVGVIPVIDKYASGTKICLMPALLVENEGVMALVVFLRGVNVGGHRTFRPSLLANELSDFDLVNVGAAGTFVVRNRISQARLRAELTKRLPFETEVVICKGSDVLELKSANPFAGQPTGPKIVWFVSILAERGRPLPSTPFSLPSGDEWCLKILAIKDRFVLGLYRREMKAIRYLGQLDKLFGVPATTRNWNTITAIARILQTAEP